MRQIIRSNGRSNGRSHGTRGRARAALVIAAALLFAAPDAVALDGAWIEFHGWCPDSSCYAYSVVTIETKRERERRTEEHRLVELSAKRRPRVRRYKSVDQIRRRAHVEAFVGAPAPSIHVDPDGEGPADPSVRFPLDDGRVVTFELVVGDALGYRVTLTDGGRPTDLASGTYDDLYTSTDAFAYVSPDGRKLALLVYGENPWRVRGEVHFVRLPAPPPIPVSEPGQAEPERVEPEGARDDAPPRAAAGD